jgi:hypothetical protein
MAQKKKDYLVDRNQPNYYTHLKTHPMKKIRNILLSGLFVAFSGMTVKVQAQAPASHVFHVNTQYSVAGLDSVARGERNAMLKEYHEKVTMKNEFVLHTWSMNHFMSEDSREFVTIYEVASWNDLPKAFDRDTELEKQAWPDAKQRAEFMKKMGAYFTHHKDAIFNGLPSLTK